MGSTEFPVDDLGLYTFFNGDKPSHLVIPHYQRGYSWEIKHLDDFWGDLDAVRSDPTNEYYFGNIVGIKDKDTTGLLKYQLVDGQQRIATCAILLVVIRDLYMKIGSSIVKESEKEIFNLKNPKSSDYHYKIKLDDDDNDYFKDTILATIDPKVLDKKEYVKKSDTHAFSTRNKLKKAYIFFHDAIWSKIETMSLVEQEAELNEIRSTLRTNFVVTLLQVEKESKAYVLFDRLNSRGRELAQSDLVKDYILSQVSDNVKTGKSEISLKDAIKIWGDISNSHKKNSSDLNDFLHHYLNAFETKNDKGKYSFNSKNKLYDKLGIISKHTSGEKLLKNLRDANILYKIIRDGTSHSKISNLCRDDLFWLKGLGVKIVYPLLLVGLKKFKKNDFEKLTSLCLKYMFRVKTVMNVNASQLEQELAEIAFCVYHKNMTVSQIKDKLIQSSNNPSHETFQSQMKDIEFSKSSHQKYLLVKLIEHDQPRSVTDITAVASASVEHIMPRKIKDDWHNYIIKHNGDVKNKNDAEIFQKKYLNSLGNLTIVSLPKNSSLGNKPYDDKMKKYLASQIGMTSELKKYPIWNLKSIKKRQEKFSEQARKIWKL